jgi:hemin uptake protein HemP
MMQDDDNNFEKPPAPDKDGEPRVFDVSALMGSCREAILVHEGARYTLRITANRKLILTK